jgi:transcription-repair coupling factor (superfamily II helicase)
VENGLDIPNANTIIINRADRYGLAQLYQLRGRVGRSDRRAYAYLLIPAEQTLSAIARRRLAAMREFSDLGSGFRIAALDLEIRGAGNLLGGEQSGHIEAVGTTPIQSCSKTRFGRKGEELEDERHARSTCGRPHRRSYIADMNQRWRSTAGWRTRSVDDVGAIGRAAHRRAALPPACSTWPNTPDPAGRRSGGLESLDRQGSAVVLKFRQDAKSTPRAARLVRRGPDPAAAGRARLDLERPVTGRRPQAAEPANATGAAGPKRPGARAGVRFWWTSRATADEVTLGFTREAVTAEAALDPAAPGGLFERLGKVLGHLSQGLLTG